VRTDALFDAAGTLRDTYLAVDWAATPLGPTDTWTPTLRTALDVLLHSRFPITLMWGPEFVLVYNEAYVELIGDKHPSALGSPSRDVFPEAWDTIGPMMASAFATGIPAWVEDEPVPLDRRGFLEECYFTFCYSAVRSPDGVIEGVVDIASETTRQIIDRRRLELLSRLGARLADVEDVADVADRARDVLATGRDDLAAAALHLPDRPDADRDPRLPAAPALDGRAVVLADTPAGRIAWLPLDLPRDGSDAATLTVLLSDRLLVDDAYLEFLRLIASSLAQALDRVAVRAAERAVAETERGLSEALQRSLLTEPPQSDRLRVGVRYQPAASQAQIGGDWYDAFELPDGSLTLVIGDVAGHDRHAAAAMAQVRNLLRGVCSTLLGPPARVLAGLDQAMRDLRIDVFATAVLAQVVAGADGCTLRWSNAGHLPPMLLGPDGSVRTLGTERGDLLLGLTGRERRDHELALPAGSSVVLYTDGLVERRGVPLPESLRWLTGVLEGRQDLDPDALCEHVVGTLEGTVEDDVALLVLKVC
jgi:serine phosphatase RsbU (regulator of sigma subunit)